MLQVTSWYQATFGTGGDAGSANHSCTRVQLVFFWLSNANNTSFLRRFHVKGELYRNGIADSTFFHRLSVLKYEQWGHLARPQLII
jgi:hypothetical protein